MQDPYPIPVFRSPAQGSVNLPGSKSITNRALVLAALAEGESRLENCLFSRDTELMIQALRDLGFQIEENAASKTIRVVGAGGGIPADRAKISIGNSGTSARFLTAMLAIREGGEFEVDGDPAMRRRPIASLVNTLVQLGCDIETSDGFFPIRIRPRGLSGGAATIDASESSQFVSALLMAAPYARMDTKLTLSDPSVRRGYIDMTIDMMRSFGVSEDDVASDESSYTIKGRGTYVSKPHGYNIESDASAASYFLALPLAVGGEVEVKGITKNSIQGDIEFANVLESIGTRIEWHADRAVVRFDARGSKARALHANFYKFSDTFLTAAAMAPLLSGPSFISGIAHTRHQECDRIAAMKDGLLRLGQTVKDTESSIEIGPEKLRPATIETYEDHRVAMSFSILGSHDAGQNGKPWMEIIDPLCCKKTFPDFFEQLSQVRESSHMAV